MHPMGYDAFGLPAENAAIKSGQHPAVSTRENIAAIRVQMQPHGLVDRLDARAVHVRARLLPLDAVDLPAAVRGRPGLPQERGRQVVPQRPDGAGQRAGDRRPLRALRRRGRGQEPGAVVLQDHRLRAAAAGRPGRGAMAGAGRDHAAQLDRPQRGRRGHVPGRARPVDRAAGVHHAAGHAVRRHLLRAGARAPAGGWSWRAAPSTRRRWPTTCGARSALSEVERADPRRRRPASSPAATSSTRSTARRSRCGSPTTC